MRHLIAHFCCLVVANSDVVGVVGRTSLARISLIDASICTLNPVRTTFATQKIGSIHSQKMKTSTSWLSFFGGGGQSLIETFSYEEIIQALKHNWEKVVFCYRTEYKKGYNISYEL